MSVDANCPEASQAHHEPTTPLKIVLIGGTGFVGSQLAPALERRGHQIIVASRNPDPARSIIGAENWADAIVNANIVVLLSVINNDVE